MELTWAQKERLKELHACETDGDNKELYWNLLSLVEELEATQMILSVKSFEQLFKTLRNINYINVGNEVVHVETVIEKIKEASIEYLDNRHTQNTFLKIPEKYALRAKTIEILQPLW